MTPTINLSFLLKGCLRQCFRVEFKISIQRTERAGIQNNIETVIFTGVLHEILKSIFKLTPSGNV